MQVFGCHVISKLDANGAEGFCSTVHRDGAMRGPFLSIEDAVKCARDWSSEPAVEVTSQAVETVEESSPEPEPTE